MEFRIPMGSTARDIITGFTGAVTAQARYITGCDQYVLVPRGAPDKIVKGEWFDDNRLEVLEKTQILIPALSPTTTKRGGPQRDAP